MTISGGWLAFDNHGCWFDRSRSRWLGRCAISPNQGLEEAFGPGFGALDFFPQSLEHVCVDQFVWNANEEADELDIKYIDGDGAGRRCLTWPAS